MSNEREIVGKRMEAENHTFVAERDGERLIFTLTSESMLLLRKGDALVIIPPDDWQIIRRRSRKKRMQSKPVLAVAQ